MAPVETTDAATVDQRCSFKHWAGWRHSHSNSKLCVALRMGQANLFCITNCRLCAGAMLSSRSHYQQLDLCVSSLIREPCDLRREEGKKKPNLCVSSLCRPYFRIVQEKNYPTQILTVILAQGAMQQCPESHHLCTEPCSSVQKKKLRHPCAGAMQHCPAEAKASSSSRSSYLRTSIGGYHRFATREHHERSFWRETWR